MNHQNLIKSKKYARGFTFIEIMFVVVIIGVLLAVAVPRLTGQSREARIRATELSINNVSTALKRYELQVGAFPEEITDLMEEPSDVEGWDGPYLEKEPKDAWNQTLNYRYPSDNDIDFDIWSNGPDKQEGTEDDVVNWSKDD